MGAPESTIPPWRLALRSALLLGILAYMIWIPLSLLRGQPVPYGWRMFHNIGKDMCVVRYVLQKGRAAQPLDRFRVLGYRDAATAPSWLRRVFLRRSEEASKSLDDVTQMICRRLGPDAPRLRLHAKCATLDRWVTTNRGRHPVCRRGAPTARATGSPRRDGAGRS